MRNNKKDNDKMDSNNINKRNVFRNNIIGIAVCMLLCLIVSACGKDSVPEENPLLIEDAAGADAEAQGEDIAENADTGNVESDNVESDNVETDSAGADITENGNRNGQQTIEKNQTPARRIEVVPASKASINKRENGREITAEEMQYFSEFVQTGNNYGFLLSAYDMPADVDLNRLCYIGLIGSQDVISEEEKEAYQKTVGWTIETAFDRITTAQLNDFLIETTGLSYEQMNHPLSWWTYLPEYDAYYFEHGDTNYERFSCIGGYTEDEKFFVLRMVRVSMDLSEVYGPEYELVLEKCGDTYQFRSNRQMPGDGIIEEQSFDVNLSPMGEVTFLSYEPDVAKNPYADVSFSIMQDGWEVQQLSGPFKNNIRTNDEFEKIEAIAFADYDEDGVTDIIMILDYSFVSGPNVAETYSEVRIYKGEYKEYSDGYSSYYQRYQPELSESLTAEFSAPTIRGVLDYIAVKFASEREVEER